MTKRILSRSFWILSLLFYFSGAFVFAQQVHAIKSAGVLDLDNGEQITLAGLQIPEESLQSLSVILTKKEISYDEEDAGKTPNQGASKSVYLYVNSKELDFPFKPGAEPRTKKIMVNELLLSLGLARVDSAKLFKRKQAFLALEADANRRGMGIWSYEPIIAKTPK